MTKKVSKNPIKLDASVYESLIETSSVDLLGKVKSGELEVPKTDYEAIRKFSDMDIEARKAFVQTLKSGNSNEPDAGDTPPSDTDVSVGGDKPASGDSAISGEGNQPANKPPSEKSDGSEYLVELSSLNKVIEGQRAKNGQLGNENKTLKKQLEELQAKITSSGGGNNQSDDSAIGSELPIIPLIPDSDAFTEGIYDPGYKEAMENYRTVQIPEWNKQFAEYVKSSKPAWATEHEKELEKIKQQSEAANLFVQSHAQTAAKTETEQLMQTMWNDLKSLQSAVGFNTSIPIDVINENQLIINQATVKNEDGSLRYAPEQVAVAQKIIKSLPENEYKNYDKICKIVQHLYTFDGNGRPQRLNDLDNDLAWQHAVRKAGLSGVIIKNPPSNSDLTSRLANQQQQHSNAPDMMASSNIGGDDGSLTDNSTTLEKQKKLLEMAKKINQNRSVMGDTAFMGEYDKLRAELGYATKRG
jgi:hypothetical protein